MELFVVLDKNNFQFNWNMVSNFLYDAILFKNILKGKIPAIEESVYEEYMHKVFEEGDTILIHDLDATYDLSAPYIEQPEDIYDDGIRYRDFIHNAILREPRYLIHINLYDMYSKRFLDMLDSFGIDKNNIIIFGNRKIKIEVSMFGGICSIDTSLMSKNKRIIVYIFGIVANVILILIFKYLCQCIYSQMIIKYNLMLIFFSLLPIYPLDGYRIIREIFAEKTSIYISYITLFIIFLINIYLQSVGIFVITIYLFFKQKNNKEEELFKKLLLIKNTCNYKKINV